MCNSSRGQPKKRHCTRAKPRLQAASPPISERSERWREAAVPLGQRPHAEEASALPRLPGLLEHWTPRKPRRVFFLANDQRPSIIGLELEDNIKISTGSHQTTKVENTTMSCALCRSVGWRGLGTWLLCYTACVCVSIGCFTRACTGFALWIGGRDELEGVICTNVSGLCAVPLPVAAFSQMSPHSPFPHPRPRSAARWGNASSTAKWSMTMTAKGVRDRPPLSPRP